MLGAYCRPRSASCARRRPAATRGHRGRVCIGGSRRGLHRATASRAPALGRRRRPGRDDVGRPRYPNRVARRGRGHARRRRNRHRGARLGGRGGITRGSPNLLGLHRTCSEPTAWRGDTGRTPRRRNRRGSPCQDPLPCRPRSRPVDAGGNRSCDPRRDRCVQAPQGRGGQAPAARLGKRLSIQSAE